MTLTLAEPLVAAILGVALLDERVGPYGWLGAAVVAAGLVVAGRGERRGDAAPAPAEMVRARRRSSRPRPR